MPIRYSYTSELYSIQQIQSDISKTNLPTPLAIYGSGYNGPNTLATSIEIEFDPQLTQAQKTTLDSLIANHVPTLKVDIKDDAEALAKVAKLNGQSKQKLTDLVVADLVRRRPELLDGLN